MKKALIIHGSFGSPKENWFPWLTEQLVGKDIDVLAPQFPVDDYDQVASGKVIDFNQSLDSWLSYFEENVAKFIDNETTIFAHSIAPVFLLHAFTKHTDLSSKASVFVCPFLKLESKDFYEVNHSFYSNDFDFKNLSDRLGKIDVLYSQNDPYVDEKLSEEFANKLEAYELVFPTGGHLNSESGFTEFPQLLDLL